VTTSTSLNGASGEVGPAPRVNGSVAPVVRSPLPTRERRPGLLALGLVVVLGAGALFGWLYSTAGEKTPVVVVTSQIPVGQVIERTDLSTVDVAGAVTAIAGGNLDSVVGERASVTLLPGTLLQRSMVTDADPLPAGQAQVGVAVRSGQMPADGVVPGDRVTVLRLAAAQATDATEPKVLVQDVAVYAVRDDPTQAGTALVTLLVKTSQGPAVAAASGAGSAALIKVATS
jgi:hypothetical protein